jgi:hypothetical protein
VTAIISLTLTPKALDINYMLEIYRLLGEQIAQSNIIQGLPQEKVEKGTNVPKKRKNKKNRF